MPPCDRTATFVLGQDQNGDNIPTINQFKFSYTKNTGKQTTKQTLHRKHVNKFPNICICGIFTSQRFHQQFEVVADLELYFIFCKINKYIPPHTNMLPIPRCHHYNKASIQHRTCIIQQCITLRLLRSHCNIPSAVREFGLVDLRKLQEYQTNYLFSKVANDVNNT